MKKRHEITLDHPTNGWERVGNSMSTVYRWDGRHAVEISWKRNRYKKQIPAKAGDIIKVIIHPAEDEPISAFVMRRPTDPVAAAAWQHGFYKKMRVSSFEDLLAAVEKCTAYSRLHDGQIIAARIFKGENVAFAYRAVMEWQCGKPFRWWANKEASAEEVNNILTIVLNKYGPPSEAYPPATGEQAITHITVKEGIK